MQKIKTKILITALFCLFIRPSLFSQTLQDTVQYQVETRDGNQYVGRIISEDSAKVVFKTKIGTILIPLADITLRKAIRPWQVKNGVLWFDNPQATRYFFAPNGYGLRRGEAYYQNIWLFFNQFAVGITENISIGAGVVPLFLFAGSPTPVWITPKVSIPIVREKINLAAGALAGTVIGIENTSFGILYGNATFGSRDKNMSFGTGYMFAGGEFASTPMFNFAAMVRATNRGYFLTENYFTIFDGKFGGFLIIGGRWIIKKVALDYGLGIPAFPDMGSFYAFPWLGITIPFGNVPN